MNIERYRLTENQLKFLLTVKKEGWVELLYNLSVARSTIKRYINSALDTCAYTEKEQTILNDLRKRYMDYNKQRHNGNNV